ncbi:hypothetical protein [Paenibacillus sp. ISL-20]|uniref:hypothetical protein n=1 Tax=Paenibacillus sp. ISL-20 TaxID=2819163 RepID=UPI001BEB0419|nr:hypothetical protein [Paenibacillus sp. ISL-20]MBT2763588.1 hypothetical protein [Paenibacillus sp. ISL-20]
MNEQALPDPGRACFVKIANRQSERDEHGIADAVYEDTHRALLRALYFFRCGQACSAKETTSGLHFQNYDMIHLKVVNNILDETRFSFR